MRQVRRLEIARVRVHSWVWFDFFELHITKRHSPQTCERWLPGSVFGLCRSAILCIAILCIILLPRAQLTAAIRRLPLAPQQRRAAHCDARKVLWPPGWFRHRTPRRIGFVLDVKTAAHSRCCCVLSFANARRVSAIQPTTGENVDPSPLNSVLGARDQPTLCGALLRVQVALRLARCIALKAWQTAIPGAWSQTWASRVT